MSIVKSLSKNASANSLNNFQFDPVSIRSILGDAGNSNKVSLLIVKIDELYKKERNVLLTELFDSLSECVSHINTTHADLITVLLDFFKWDTEDEELLRAASRFIYSLVSAHAFYASKVFLSLVKHFIPQQQQKDELEDFEQEKIGWSRIHQVIRTIINLVPKSSTSLLSVLESNFPHQLRFEVLHHKSYVFNLLQVIEFVPALQNEILSLVVSRLITLDSLIKTDTPDEEELVFGMETLSDDDKNVISKTSRQLDALMDLTFEYLDKCNDSVFFETLLHLFDQKILPTIRPKFAQFLLFYYCRLNLSYSEGFVGYLLHKLNDVSTHTITKQNIIGYVGSYVARASYLPTKLILHTLGVLLDFSHSYLQRLTGRVVPNVRAHSVFYMAFQSILYILDYAADQILKGPSSITFAELDLNALIMSPLNPLKFCQAGIVAEFASIAEENGVHYIKETILRNERICIPKTEDADGVTYGLENFFPFDPYLLKDSFKKIEPIYRNWSVRSKEKKEKIPRPEEINLSSQDMDSSIGSPLSTSMVISQPNSYAQSPSITGMSLDDSSGMTRSTADLTFHFMNAVEVGH